MGEMVGWHHQLNGHEFEQSPGDNEGQGSLACCRPWGRRVRHNLVTGEQEQSQRWSSSLDSIGLERARDALLIDGASPGAFWEQWSPS